MVSYVATLIAPPVVVVAPRRTCGRLRVEFKLLLINFALGLVPLSSAKLAGLSVKLNVKGTRTLREEMKPTYDY